jgi:hypothetical protein
MAKVSHLVCDVTGIADETVQSVKLPFPIVDADSPEGEFKVVTLSLDIASKALNDILVKVGKDIKPLFTENTTATVRGDSTAKKSENGDDAPAEFGTPEFIRQWARANGHKVGDRGALPKKVSEAFQAAVKNGEVTPPTADETTDSE